MSSQPHPVGKDDLFRLKFVQSAHLSPDCTRLVYAVSHIETTIDPKDEDGKPKDEERVTLWLMTLDTGETRQLTAGLAKDTAPAWSPDGSRIAFVSTRGEKPQIHLIPVDGGEAQALTAIKQGVGGGPVWSPDGTTIAFMAGPAAEPPDPADPYRVTRPVYRFDNMGNIDAAIQDLYIIDAAGGEPRQLTNDLSSNGSPRWSPDGTKLLYLASMHPDTHRAMFPRICLLNVADGTSREVTPDSDMTVGAAEWLPDGKRIAFVGRYSDRPIGSKDDLWVIDAQGGKPDCRTATLKEGIGGGLLSDMPLKPVIGVALLITKDGDQAVVQVQAGGTIHLYRVALDGAKNWEPVTSGDRACFQPDLSDDDRTLVYSVSTLHDPANLFVTDLATGDERQLTTLNADVLSEWIQPEVVHLLYPGVDGVEIEGWLVKPTVGEAPYPTVMYIHGGPHAAFGHIFHFDTLMLSGVGYAVLLLNQRASTGYGDEFSTAIKGDWGNLDYADLMSGVDYAIAQGLTDADRLGVCGLSGGGNLSCWIVGQTDRFKAAVPENPVTNFTSFYGVSDIGVWFSVEELGGHPWEIPDVYARCSPITYAHNCTTPTLMVQGEHDWRCPAEQSEQFYTVLKATGCIVQMLRFPNSAHGGASYGPVITRRVQNDALLDWMNRYVLDMDD